MRTLKRLTWGTDHYPFVNITTFAVSAIPRDSYHDLMNTIPKETKDGLRDTSLLFQLTLTQLLSVYENYRTNIAIDEFISDAYICFNSRYNKFNVNKSNWFSYCRYIKFDVIKLLKVKFENEFKYVDLVMPADLED